MIKVIKKTINCFLIPEVLLLRITPKGNILVIDKIFENKPNTTITRIDPTIIFIHGDKIMYQLNMTFNNQINQ